LVCSKIPIYWVFSVFNGYPPKLVGGVLTPENLLKLLNVAHKNRPRVPVLDRQINRPKLAQHYK
jgi:hypothetical protein